MPTPLFVTPTVCDRARDRGADDGRPDDLTAFRLRERRFVRLLDLRGGRAAPAEAPASRRPRQSDNWATADSKLLKPGTTAAGSVPAPTPPAPPAAPAAPAATAPQEQRLSAERSRFCND